MYVFENRGSKPHLLHEISPQPEDEAWYVEWGPLKGKTGHKRWRNVTSRSFTGIKGEVLLKKGKKYFALLSQFQLPFERIIELESSPEFLKRRATAFETSSGENALLIQEDGKEILEVYLLDPIRVALYLQYIYILAHERYIEYSGDPKTATFANIAQSAWRIAEFLNSKGKDAWSWVDKDKLESDINKVKKIADKLQDERRNACLRRNKWYKTDLFNEGLNDLEFEEDLVSRRLEFQSVLLECSFESEEGQEYLNYAFDHDPRYKLWIQNPFGVGRRVIKIIKDMRFHDQAFSSNINILKQMAFQKIKALELEEAERQVAAIIKDKFGVESVVWKDARGKTGKINLREEGVESLGEYYDYRKMHIADKADFRVERMKLNKVTMTKFMVAIEMINLMFAAKTFLEEQQKAREEWDNWDERRSFLGLIKASSDLLRTLGKVSYVEGMLAKRLAKKSANRMLRGLAIVAAIVDYIGGLMDIYKGYKKDQADLAISGSLIAFAGVAGAASVAAEVTGAAILGLSSLSWTIVGAILLLAALFVLWLFYEEPLEKWLRDTPWGNPKAVDWVTGREHLNSEQLHHNLYKIISAFYLRQMATVATGSDSLHTDAYRLVSPYLISMWFGYLPPTAIVDIKFEGLFKEYKTDETYRQFAHIQVMPYLNSYILEKGQDLQFDDATGPFWVGKDLFEGRECRSLFINLVDRHIHSRCEEIWNEYRRTKNLKIINKIEKLIDWTYTIRIDLFGDGSMRIPFNGDVVMKKESGVMVKLYSYDLE